MGTVHDEISPALRGWIEEQHMFFVATAPLAGDGLINCSPKGLDSFRVLGPRDVAYIDLTGSGIETIAHLRQNGRIVIMFCARALPRAEERPQHRRAAGPHSHRSRRLNPAYSNGPQENAQMTEPIAQNQAQVLTARRWMEDEAGMERASLSPAEYVAYRMKVSPAEAAALVAAVYALDEEE